MYAIVQQGGHQYRVAPGDRLLVDQLQAPVGSVVALEPVLVLERDEGATIGVPVVEGARVAATVVAHRRGEKLRVFKYKPKKRYRRTRGHRAELTELRVDALLGAGEPLPTAVTEPPAAPRRRARPSAGEAAEAAEPPAPAKRTRARAPRAEGEPPSQGEFTEV